MVAQRYRHRIAIEEVVETQDSATGAVTHTWQTVDLDSDHDLSAVPASVLTGPGRDGIGAGHSDSFHGRADPHGDLLREWVGGDAEAYQYGN